MSEAGERQDSGNQGRTHISRRWNHRRQGCIVANSVLCWALFHRDPACTRVTLAAKVTMSTHQRIEAGNARCQRERKVVAKGKASFPVGEPMVVRRREQWEPGVRRNTAHTRVPSS